MEQKDYILREIEKISKLLQAIINKFLGNNDNSAIKVENSFEETNELLFKEIGFDIDKFVNLGGDDSENYIDKFKGFNINNLELLAEAVFAIGFNEKSDKRKNYLIKALWLYEFCNMKDKTFSFDRESKIAKVKSYLS